MNVWMDGWLNESMMTMWRGITTNNISAGATGGPGRSGNGQSSMDGNRFGGSGSEDPQPYVEKIAAAFHPSFAPPPGRENVWFGATRRHSLHSKATLSSRDQAGC